MKVPAMLLATFLLLVSAGTAADAQPTIPCQPQISADQTIEVMRSTVGDPTICSDAKIEQATDRLLGIICARTAENVLVCRTIEPTAERAADAEQCMSEPKLDDTTLSISAETWSARSECTVTPLRIYPTRRVIVGLRKQEICIAPGSCVSLTSLTPSATERAAELAASVMLRSFLKGKKQPI